ncbi:MAG: tail fiber domain-containing protein, partial [Gammaproteobacteria bacterium]|nr:tail fiber domain-containing protein [Gammaproteobacteria bacterium]
DRKENIAELRLDVATEALMALQPVVFNYRDEPQEDYLGFIAEDVPELVAVKDRDALSPMDIVAVLTRVVQQQERKIQALEARLDAL